MRADLFPKLPRKLKQPAKHVLRDQLALAADALMSERAMVMLLQRRLDAINAMARGVDQDEVEDTSA